MYRLVIRPGCLAVRGRDPPLRRDYPKSFLRIRKVAELRGAIIKQKYKSFRCESPLAALYADDTVQVSSK